MTRLKDVFFISVNCSEVKTPGFCHIGSIESVEKLAIEALYYAKMTFSESTACTALSATLLSDSSMRWDSILTHSRAVENVEFILQDMVN